MKKQFNFRSKFEKIISSDVESEVYQNAFGKFCTLNQEDALRILWALTYDEHTQELDNIGLYAGNNPENFIILRNELRYQYQQHVDIDFLKIDVPEEAKEAYLSLEKYSDTIVAVVVFNHCTHSTKYSDEFSRDRIAFLLESYKESNKYGGLRSLSFNQAAADYLLPFCEKISSLFKVLNEKKKQSERNTPLAGLGALIKDAGMDLPFEFGDSIPDDEEQSEQESVVPAEPEPQATQPAENNSGFRRVYAEAILMHKDIFASFVKDDNMNALLEIGRLGFDLNEVMAKKEKIYNLISALQEKEKAEFLMSLAVRELNG